MSNTTIVIFVSLFGWMLYRRIGNALKPRRYNLVGACIGLALILAGLVRVIAPNATIVGYGYAAIGLITGGFVAYLGFKSVEFLEITGSFSGIYRNSKVLNLSVFILFLAALVWRISSVVMAAQQSGGSSRLNPEILLEILRGNPLLAIVMPTFFLCFYLLSLSWISLSFLKARKIKGIQPVADIDVAS